MNLPKNDITNIFELVDYLICYLKENGWKFTDDGKPIFNIEDFVQSIPSKMLPYDHRLESKDDKTTSVCFYQPDKSLYRRLTLFKLIKCAQELKKYHSFVGFDLSIFRDFLYPFQEFYVLANLVVDAFFISFGNKMIPNLRCDETDGESYFYLFGNAPIVCAGTLGCGLFKELKISNKKLLLKYSIEHPNQTLILYGNNLVSNTNTIYFKGFGRRWHIWIKAVHQVMDLKESKV